MQTILETPDVTWQKLEGDGEVLNSSTTLLGAISGLAILPVFGDEQEETRGLFDDTADDTAGRANRQGYSLPAGHTSNSTSGDDSITRSPKPQQIRVTGGRAVLATRAVDGVDGSTTGVGILEHGFGLDAAAKGSIGLPEGSTLFAQRVVLRGAVRHYNGSFSSTGGNGGPFSGRQRDNEEINCGNTTQQEGHVLLLSDRVRSKTNILVVSSDGEVAPVVTGTDKVRRFVGSHAKNIPTSFFRRHTNVSRFAVGAIQEIDADCCPRASPIQVCLPCSALTKITLHHRFLLFLVLYDPQGFDVSRHTVHLGRIQPGEYIVQVTEEAVNVVRQAASGSFELAASWRPPPLPPRSSSSSFKVQHAGTAGTIVAVVFENTMFLIEVREVAANQATRARTGGENPASPATSAAVQAKEVLRAELDGGPVSALAIRLLGGDGAAEESLERE